VIDAFTASSFTSTQIHTESTYYKRRFLCLHKVASLFETSLVTKVMYFLFQASSVK